MKPLLALLFLLTLSLATHARTTYDFNSDWRLFKGDASGAEKSEFDDSSWQTVTTPRAWNDDEAFRLDIAELSTGIAWYRKHFRLPANASGKKVFIEFEGIRQAGEFYVNGTFVGRHENGVTAFGFDLTELVKDGDNVIAVRIDNSWDYKEKASGSGFQWSDKNFNANYGGINKRVFLHVAEKVYQTLPLYTNLGTTGIYVYAKDIDAARKTATVTAESEVRNDSATPRTFVYGVVVNDSAGKEIARFGGQKFTLAAGATKTVGASKRLANLNFWSWGYGYLYDVATTISENGKPLDTVVTRTGFRKTEFGNGLFKLNGRTLQLKGYAQRTSNEWPALGNAVPAWLSDFSNGLMVESNANLVRWMHITPSKQDVESCDRVGLIQAMPAGDAEKDVEGRRWQQRIEVMRDAIIYNRNNPSVIFYESGNESISEAHMAEMKALRDKFDPHGGRAAGSREMLDSRVAEYGGEMLYINKSARLPFWAMEYSRDEGLRKYWDEFSPPFHKDGDGPLYKNADASVYNRNQDSHAIENVVRWFDYWESRPGTGKRVSSGGVNIIFSDSNTHHRGAENYRRSGEVDAMRLPKDGFYAHQVTWDGWVDVERPHTHIIGHWNYAPGVKKNVYVVSSADSVELFLNGKSLGRGEQSSRFLFTFKDVAWQAGELRAVGSDAKMRVVSSDRKRTAGEAFGIKLTPRTAPDGLRADGADVALVDVEVVDKDGNRCPTALDMIDFSVDGPAEWRGGIAQGEDNFILKKSLPVENGVNRVILRSTRAAGKIVVRANSGALKSAEITLEAKPFAVKDGLYTEIRNLPSNLLRGATPSGESFVMTRFANEIAAVRAGSNIERAIASFDDNELTEWLSDGKQENGWIEYDLAAKTTVSQVVMKLVGWRTQSYPLRILVDGKEVWTGTTPRTLGYVTIKFPAVEGKTVRIELAGAASNRDAFGNIIEITGIPDPNSAANKGGKTVLGIVETEIYR